MDWYANPRDHQGAGTLTAEALSSIPFSGRVRVLDAPAAEDGCERPPDEPGQGDSDGRVHRQRHAVRPEQELQVLREVGRRLRRPRVQGVPLLGLGVPGAAGPHCERVRADLAFTNPREFQRLAMDALRKPGLSGLSDPAFKER